MYDYPMVSVYVSNGTMRLSCWGMTSYLKDTVGLEEYLGTILRPLLQISFTETEGDLNQLYEELSRASKEEKI